MANTCKSDLCHFLQRELVLKRTSHLDLKDLCRLLPLGQFELELPNLSIGNFLLCLQDLQKLCRFEREVDASVIS